MCINNFILPSAYGNSANINILEKDKKWLVALGMFNHPDNKEYIRDYYLYIVEDECSEIYPVPGFNTYKIRLHKLGSPIDRDTFVVASESNGVLYEYSERYKCLLPIIDTNLFEGESLCNIRVCEIDEVTDLNGDVRRRMVFDNSTERKRCFVDGIGFNTNSCIPEFFGPIPCSPGVSLYMLECYQGDECIFTWENFNDISESDVDIITDSDNSQLKKIMIDLKGYNIPLSKSLKNYLLKRGSVVISQ